MREGPQDGIQDQIEFLGQILGQEAQNNKTLFFAVGVSVPAVRDPWDPPGWPSAVMNPR